MGSHFLPPGTGRTAGRLFRWRRRGSLLAGFDGGRRRRGLHNNALVRLRGPRSRRRRGNVYHLRSRLPLGAAAKNNGNTENCCFPAQGILILSLQQRPWAGAAGPFGFVKKHTITWLAIGYTSHSDLQAPGNSREILIRCRRLRSQAVWWLAIFLSVTFACCSY